MAIMAKVENVNVRGCESRTNKNGDGYLLVHFEDECGRAETLVDKDLERKEYYKRDTVGTFTIEITTGRYTNLRIIDFKIG